MPWAPKRSSRNFQTSMTFLTSTLHLFCCLDLQAQLVHMNSFLNILHTLHHPSIGQLINWWRHLSTQLQPCAFQRCLGRGLNLMSSIRIKKIYKRFGDRHVCCFVQFFYRRGFILEVAFCRFFTEEDNHQFDWQSSLSITFLQVAIESRAK